MGKILSEFKIGELLAGRFAPSILQKEKFTDIISVEGTKDDFNRVIDYKAIGPTGNKFNIQIKSRCEATIIFEKYNDVSIRFLNSKGKPSDYIKLLTMYRDNMLKDTYYLLTIYTDCPKRATIEDINLCKGIGYSIVDLSRIIPLCYYKVPCSSLNPSLNSNFNMLQNAQIFGYLEENTKRKLLANSKYPFDWCIAHEDIIPLSYNVSYKPIMKAPIILQKGGYSTIGFDLGALNRVCKDAIIVPKRYI